MMGTLLQDLKHGLRMLARNPGSTAAATLALALGIGATTTLYSVINAVIFHPLVAKDLDRMVEVSETIPRKNLDHIKAAPANFRDWKEQNQGLDLLAAWAGWGVNVSGAGIAERAEAYRATADFFPLFGIAPQFGRTFAAEDFEPGRASVVVLSHGFWERHFGGAPGMVGKAVLLNGEKFDVIGVMPSDMDFPPGGDLWAPLDLSGARQADRSDHYLEVIGHLKPTVTISQAQANLQSIAARLGGEYPATNAGHSVQVMNLVESFSQGIGPQLAEVLMGAAAFVLLLACANVANLLLARATTREREIAVRRALGASRWQIAQGLLVESLLMATLSGLPGVVLTSWGLHLMRRATPPSIIQHVAGARHMEVDSRVLAFTLVVALLTGILAGLAPALHASHPDLTAALKAGTRGGTSGPARGRLRALLVVLEVALALVLLVGAGLMVKGFHGLLNLDPGFDRENLLTFRVTLSESKYQEKDRAWNFYDQVLQKLEALPGAESAAAVTSLPSGRSWNWSEYTAEGQPPAAPGELRVAVSQQVSPDFFRALRVALLNGRFFTARDGPEAPPVAIISEALARRAGFGQDAVGKRIKMGRAESNEPWRTIVGVVATIRQLPIDEHPDPAVYVPLAQLPPTSSALVVRAAGDPLKLAAAARAAVKSVDADEPPYDFLTLEQLFSNNVLGLDYATRLMTVFGAIATVLAAAGIFSVVAYSVAQRTQEIGVRMALGAQRAEVVQLVLGYALKPAIAGLAIGVAGALAVTRALGGMLFGVFRIDALTFTAFGAFLVLVAALAAYFPARRASKVDPMVALRYE